MTIDEEGVSRERRALLVMQLGRVLLCVIISGCLGAWLPVAGRGAPKEKRGSCPVCMYVCGGGHEDIYSYLISTCAAGGAAAL